MLGHLIDLVMAVWRADGAMRDQSVVGQSKMDRESRSCVSIICGVVVGLLLLAWVIIGVVWWWTGS